LAASSSLQLAKLLTDQPAASAARTPKFRLSPALVLMLQAQPYIRRLNRAITQVALVRAHKQSSMRASNELWWASSTQMKKFLVAALLTFVKRVSLSKLACSPIRLTRNSLHTFITAKQNDHSWF
jgi:hypothetical protein